MKDYHPIKDSSDFYGGATNKTDKGRLNGASEESEEIFDDEIQSSSEGSMDQDNLNSARKSNLDGSQA